MLDLKALGATIIGAGKEIGTAALDASGKVITKANEEGVPDALGIAAGNHASGTVRERIAALVTRLPQGAQAPVTEALTAGIGQGTLVGGKIAKRLAQQHISNPTLLATAEALTEGAASAGNGVTAGRLEAGAEVIAQHIVD